MKVAVLGASIAGLYLAYLLAREGVEVEVYEKEREGRVEKRTLIVTNKLNEILNFDASGVIVNKVSCYELLMDAKKAAIELNEPDLVIERRELVRILAEQASAVGAMIFWGHEVTRMAIKSTRNRNNARNNEGKIEGEINGEINEINSCEALGIDDGEGDGEGARKGNKDNRRYDSGWPNRVCGCRKEAKKFVPGLVGKRFQSIGLKNKNKSGREKFFIEVIDVATGEKKIVEREMVVIASGADWNLSGNGKKTLALVQARVSFPEIGWAAESKTLRAKICQVWFDPRRTRYFFWLIPESAEVAAVGLIDERMPKATELLRNFIEERRLKPMEFQAALVPEYCGGFFTGWPVFQAFKGILPNRNRGLYAVGDAAAHVKMTTVGGVVAGLRGAKVATQAILSQVLNKAGSSQKELGNNLKNIADFRDDCSDYRRSLRELYFELNLHYILRKILNRFRAEDYVRLLARLDKDEELKRMLSRWTRDELARFLFKLLVKRPWLLSLAFPKLLPFL